MTVPQKPKRKARPSALKDHLSVSTEVFPKNELQREMLIELRDGQNVIAHGSAGTGKSFLACFSALTDLLSGEKSSIVIVRSAVQIRDMGFLPGTLDEKSDAFAIPYKEIVNSLCGSGTAWEILTKKNLIKFMTTSYVRGTTLDNCVLIIDEFQNCDPSELYSVLTRVGENTQVILCGDTKQCDLKKRRGEESSFDWIIDVASKMEDWFSVISFTSNEIVRSGFVKALIETTEEIPF